MKILDWKKVREFIRVRKPVKVSAGILNDWFFTAATVWENGKWSKKGRDAAWVTSDWATPGFKATMKNGDVVEVAANKEMSRNDMERLESRRKKMRTDIKRMVKKIKSSNTSRQATLAAADKVSLKAVVRGFN